MWDYRLRFQGQRLAVAALGDPRVFGLAFALIIGLAFVVGIAAGAIHLGHMGGLLLAAGPIVAGGRTFVDLREEAVSKWQAVHDLEGADGTIKAEDVDKYNGLVEEAVAADGVAAAAQKSEQKLESNQSLVRERLSFYQQKIMGSSLPFNTTTLDRGAGKSLGAQFVESQAYKDVIASGALNSPDKRFSSSPFIAPFAGIPGRFMAAAGDVIQTEDGGPAGDGVVRPVRLPGVLPLPQRPLTVRGLFANETISEGDSIEYAAQTGFDRATGLAVKQSTTTSDSAGVKKQSSIAWQIRNAKFEWLATWMAVSRQALSDVTQVRSAIDNALTLMLQLEEEDQLIDGDGTPPNLAGLLGGAISGIQTLNLTGFDNLDGIRDARRLVKTGLSRLTPTFVALNPIDSEEFDLLKDDFGQYRGGNPIGNFDFNAPIWRLPRVETEALAEGTALVGTREGATVYERQGIQITTADQHADFFVRNLVVILAEERLGFPVYFPSAFVRISLDEWDEALPGS